MDALNLHLGHDGRLQPHVHHDLGQIGGMSSSVVLSVARRQLHTKLWKKKFLSIVIVTSSEIRKCSNHLVVFVREVDEEDVHQVEWVNPDLSHLGGDEGAVVSQLSDLLSQLFHTFLWKKNVLSISLKHPPIGGNSPGGFITRTCCPRSRCRCPCPSSPPCPPPGTH